MELYDVLRTTFAARDFTNDPIPDDTVFKILDTARFAPSGGNRQGWRVVVVRDSALRRRIRDLYLPGWYDYLAMNAAGLVPFAPITNREAEKAARAGATAIAEKAAAGPGDFAEHLDQVPALLVVL